MTDPGALILMYHHVSDAALNPAMLNVRPSHLAEHLDVIRREACPMRLDHLVSSLQDGRQPERAVAVTFDDGYTDTLLHARPLLERYDVPATVFIATGGMDTQTEFWWDELERLLLLPGDLPETVELHLPDQTLRIEMAGAATYDEQALKRDAAWRVWEDPPTPRHALYQTLCPLLKPLPLGGISRVLDQLRSQARPNRGCTAGRLTPGEIQAMHRKGLIRIGSHTVTHPMLSTLSLEEQSWEIAAARTRLEELVGAPVDQFAYPYGDYTPATVEIIRRTGIRSACSTRVGNARVGSDPWQLPRHNVFDLEGEQFSKWMWRMWNSC